MRVDLVSQSVSAIKSSYFDTRTTVHGRHAAMDYFPTQPAVATEVMIGPITVYTTQYTDS